MKKNILYIFGLLILTLSVSGQNNSELYKKANDFYKKSQFDTAIVLYEKIVKSGFIAPEVYFNLGNSYYKKKDVSNAVLNYERARKLNPGDDDINFNLQLAQTMVLDKINIIPELFITRWWHSFSQTMSSDSWALLSIILFILTLVSVLAYLFARIYWLKVVSFWLGVVFFAFTIISVGNSYILKQNSENQSGAIVMSASVTLKSSPDDKGTDLFVLHEGSKVLIIDNVGEWLKIKISDGNSGWLKKGEVEVI